MIPASKLLALPDLKSINRKFSKLFRFCTVLALPLYNKRAVKSALSSSGFGFVNCVVKWVSFNGLNRSETARFLALGFLVFTYILAEKVCNLTSSRYLGLL